MKKYIMILMVLVSCGLYAIDYPTYKPVNSRYSSPVSSPIEQPVYGAYSTVATGGTTTTGEGSLINSGPRRVAYSGPEPQSPKDGDTWTDQNGVTWEYDGEDGWSKVSSSDAGNPDPIGDPMLPMLLFALMAGGAIALRRRQAQA